MSQLDIALSRAKRQWPVFPIELVWNEDKQKYDKPPRCAGGFHARTTDPATIKGWFANTNWQCGLVPADIGCLVIDQDSGADPAIIKQLPPTYKVKTPSGAFHHYYRTTEKFNNHSPWDGIDVRSAGGYVGAAGGPHYDVVCQMAVAPLPEWVAEALRERQAPAQRSAASGRVVPETELLETLALVDNCVTHATLVAFAFLTSSLKVSIRVTTPASEPFPSLVATAIPTPCFYIGRLCLPNQ